MAPVEESSTKQVRKRGVGSRMLAAVEERAREAELARILLHVALDNERAIDFYEAREFRRRTLDRQLRQFAAALGLNPELHALYTKDIS